LKTNVSAIAGDGITTAQQQSVSLRDERFERHNLPPSPVWKIVAVNDS